MAWIHPAAVEHRARLFTRHDAHRYMRPDAERRMSPEELRFEDPQAYERKYGGLPRQARPVPRTNALDIIRGDETLRPQAIALIRDAQRQIAEIRHALALRQKANFNPDQPRVPAGNPNGGQWTREGIGDASSRSDRVNSELATGREDEELAEFFEQELDNESGAQVELVGGRDRSRGHHYVPKKVFTKYKLPPETYRIFDNARTGLIPDAVANYYDEVHRAYTDAVDSRFKEFLERNKINPERMTPNQAFSFVKEVIRSRDPQIHNLNRRIWRSILRLVPRPRGTDA